VDITTKVASLIPGSSEVYSKQHFVIILRQVCWVFCVPGFAPPDPL